MTNIIMNILNNKLLLFFLLSLLLVLLLIKTPSYEYFSNKIVLEDKYIDKKDSIQIYKNLKDIDRIFNKNNIKYIIEAGTLLGAVRHKGLIPWDDDADISIEDKYFNKFLSLKDEFRKNGYGMVKISLCYKLYPLNGKSIKGKIYKYPFVDVFFIKDYGKYYHYSNKNALKTWPKAYYTHDQFNKIRYYKFGNLRLPSISKPISHLNILYGPNWNKEVQIWYDHRNDKNIKSLTFKLEDKHRKCGPYE